MKIIRFSPQAQKAFKGKRGVQRLVLKAVEKFVDLISKEGCHAALLKEHGYITEKIGPNRFSVRLPLEHRLAWEILPESDPGDYCILKIGPHENFYSDL